MKWWERFLGSRDRLGWLTLPLFAVVGLTGAVLAGTLAAVWYGQQVDALEDETAAGRQELRDAVEEVRQAADDALGAISEEVDAVQESLDRELPFEVVAEHGVVSVRAFIGPVAPAPPGGGGGEGDGGGNPDGAVLQESPTEGGGQEEQPPQQQPQEPPPPAFRSERVGSGFAVAQEGEVVFVATTFSVVADPETPAGVAEVVEVTSPAGTFPAVVHSWDAARDLALLRTELGGVEILPWRPSEDELQVGARLVVAGITPNLQGIQLAGQVGLVDVAAIITDLPRIELLAGAPVVDDEGRVVAVYATGYAPFGSSTGAEQASVPARLLCERMLRNCDALEAEPEDGASEAGS